MRFALSRPTEKYAVNEIIAAHKNALVVANIRQKSRLLQTVNKMLVGHKNAVVIANIRQENQPLVVPTPVARLRMFDTETTRPETCDSFVEIDTWPIFHQALALWLSIPPFRASFLTVDSGSEVQK